MDPPGEDRLKAPPVQAWMGGKEGGGVRVREKFIGGGKTFG